MKSILNLARSVILLAIAAPAIAAQDSKLQCAAGSLEKSFGQTTWIAHACNDGESVILISAANNPAHPYFFLLQPDVVKVNIMAAGQGNAAASEPTHEALSQLGPGDVKALFDEISALGH